MRWLPGVTVLLWALSLWLLLGVLRGPGLFLRVRRLISVLICGSLTAALTVLLIVLQLFYVVSHEEVVATVRTRWLEPGRFELVYTPASRFSGAAQQDPPLRVVLEGNQWAISGGLVKWHPWLAVTGLKSYHRPVRLSGQFSDLKRQQAAPHSIYPIDKSVDRIWELLYRASPYLPFIDAAYGSSAYVYVDPDETQEVSVSATGYLIRRARHNR